MAWRIIKQPNGKFARFSEVVDDFTHCNLDESEAYKLCCRFYDMTHQEAKTKVLSAVNNPHRFDEAINTIKVIHGDELAKEREKELSANADATTEGKT